VAGRRCRNNPNSGHYLSASRRHSPKIEISQKRNPEIGIPKIGVPKIGVPKIDKSFFGIY
jgi:hypothetical protein